MHTDLACANELLMVLLCLVPDSTHRMHASPLSMLARSFMYLYLQKMNDTQSAESVSFTSIKARCKPFPNQLSRLRSLYVSWFSHITMPLAKPADVSSHVLSQFKLDGKIAAVTGGARGIGLEVTRALAEAGASVALIYTSSKDANETAKKLSEQTGQKVVAYQSDVRDKSTITATINQIAKDFGRLDICVANAGIASHFDSLEYSQDQWKDIMQVNLDGAMYTAQAAGNIFKKQGPGSGSMIFTASVSALLVNVPQRQAAYNASKAAVVHLAKCLAVEWVDFARGMS